MTAKPARRQREDRLAVEQPVGNAVRALILRRNRVLLICKRGPDGAARYTLPGGRQVAGESLHETLLRECTEEIGCGVEILGLLHVADVCKGRERKPATGRRQVELVFHCRLPADYLPANGPVPDRYQVGVEWIGLQALGAIDLRPPGMSALIQHAALGHGPVYLGTL